MKNDNHTESVGHIQIPFHLSKPYYNYLVEKEGTFDLRKEVIAVEVEDR
ncbi:5062_t:CDS:2 [Diversispora eburnea]|uniref:5062_t:CDS:1 n=1 Tax=Diversispora eburnea TaxID=1213867 RepID=A0A9N8ZPX8_9GLOM|nr:5062_t:CDS:2 [Diversispora eburnea]